MTLFELIVIIVGCAAISFLSLVGEQRGHIKRFIQWLLAVIAMFGVGVPLLILERVFECISYIADAISTVLLKVRFWVGAAFPLPWITDHNAELSKHQEEARQEMLRCMGRN